MNWDRHELHEAERLLNQGRPSGPRLDRVWENISPTLQPQGSASRAARWWMRVGWGLVPVAALGAVLVMVRPAGFQARGEPDAPVVMMQGSCGTTDAPCRVGQPVFLKVGASPAGGVATVLQVSTQGRTVVASVPLDRVVHTPLPVKLVPDARDVTDGLRLELYLTADSVTEPVQQRLMQGGLDRPTHALVLEVKP